MPSLESRLLLVTDRHQTKGRPLVPLLAQAVMVGRVTVQLRERDLCARDLLALGQQILQLPQEVQLLINDRMDVALSLQEAGVHLRSDSLPLFVARQLIGPRRLLGASVHSTREAIEAEAAGADYVVLGPIYETPSKQMFGPPLGLSVLEDTARAVRLPIVGIGGVTARRAHDMRRAGAFGVAVISAVLGADNVEAATRALLEAVTAVS